jgi:Lon protease-like protein
MLDLPLFPLNSVLFPGMPITLHIFEDRYKAMINHCIEAAEPFGVVLIKHGTEALGPVAQPYEIGCTAQITQVEQLSQGRMNIIAVGGERFRTESVREHDDGYIVASVEMIPLDDPNPGAAAEEIKLLSNWVDRYLQTLNRAGQTDLDMDRMPNDPTLFANLAATLLQVPAEQKQPLLEAPDMLGFLRDLRQMYRREVALLDVMLNNIGNQQNPDTYMLN